MHRTRILALMTHATDFTTLIPELRQWNDGRGIAPDDWIGCVGTYELAIGYSLIFWPSFVVFESYVFRDGFLESSVRGFEQATNGNRAAVEAVMNHLHIADIHCNIADVDEGQLRFLGRALKGIYEVKLRSDFPDRRFIVSFNDDPGLVATDYELTFWQERPPS